MKESMNKNLKTQLIEQLIEEINLMANREIKIMEVCGTHTQMISKLGLRTLLSPKIKLLSGPGCPVCVTDESYIDTAIEIINKYPVTIVTFGDLMRVKGSMTSLIDEKSRGKDVRIVYSPLDIIQMAEKNRNNDFIFLGVGFETTAPIIALTIKTAAERNLKNLFFLTSIKIMEPILHYILKQPNNRINGLICPGHVATVKGSDYFEFVSKIYNIPAAVCGFEALDIVGGIYYLIKNIIEDKHKSFKNLYKKCVTNQGNLVANELMNEVFEVVDGKWRGIGLVTKSSLAINKKYQYLDAIENFKVCIKSKKTQSPCECKDILLGNKMPQECKLFNKVCNPFNPYGPCMVSKEGACAIAYRYGGRY